TPLAAGSSAGSRVGSTVSAANVSSSWPGTCRTVKRTPARRARPSPHSAHVDGEPSQLHPTSRVHEEQPSPSTVLPSSQVSLFGHAAVTIPLPQRVRVQSASHPSPETRFPSSHSSSPDPTALPQPVSVQLASQPSPFVVLPSSHCSPGSIVPLPQRVTSTKRYPP